MPWDYLESTFSMLESAYPSGLEEADYWCLLKVVSDEMSDRNTARVFEICFDYDWAVVYNDVLKIQSGNEVLLQGSDVERVRSHLQRHGLDEWLAE